MAKLNTEGLPDKAAETLAAMLPGALQVDLVTGGGSNAELTLTGIATTDKIVAAFHLPKDGTIDDIAEVTLSIAAANKVKTATATTEGKILVIWQDASNG